MSSLKTEPIFFQFDGMFMSSEKIGGRKTVRERWISALFLTGIYHNFRD